MSVAPVRHSFFDRNGLLMLVAGVCVVNGVFSPFLVVAVQITPVLMPEMFPRTVGWVLFFSSVVVSTATLLLSGVPAALYERLFETDANSTVSMWVWLAGATLMSLAAFENVHAML
ncbi:MAG: hypothetical protein HY246_12190 [Proteobacteria bacterium]|nr:hypothetical protein [Pseudomonadota bacterium]